MKQQKKWELVNAQTIFDSKWMSLENRSYKLPTGQLAENYIHLNRPDYVLVVALDDHNRLLVERQYRRGVDDFVYELPAGWIEKDESPIDAAKRELKEETGALGSGETCIEVYPQPGFSSMKAYICILKVDSVETTELGVDEDITSEWLSLDKVHEMVRDAKIQDMGFLAALGLVGSSINRR